MLNLKTSKILNNALKNVKQNLLVLIRKKHETCRYNIKQRASHNKIRETMQRASKSQS